MATNTLVKKSFNWHRNLGWWGAAALIIFGLSGILHPTMRWTGPSTIAFFPPQSQMSAAHTKVIPAILEKYDITAAKVVKVIPSKTGPVLQITESEQQARRYFALNNKQELVDYDTQHAEWLARYYTGEKAPVESITFQNEFDSAYPWVNRLLPVYRVNFASDDGLTAFIYTETNALASLTNDWKTTLQTIFRFMHTGNWLDDVEHARVILMMLLLLSLLGMAATGTAMIFFMKKRKINQSGRRWHRGIAYIIWFPVFLFSASGIYHLLQFAYGDNLRGLRLGEPLALNQTQLSSDGDWLAPYADVPLNAISLLAAPDGGLLFRLGLAQGRPGEKVSNKARFDGIPSEKSAHYFDASNGRSVPIDDLNMAIHMAEQHLGLSAEQITHTERITRFGVHYDFRNKRLPAWRIDYDSDLGDIIFIDPSTGILADRLVNSQRYEIYSFSFLHKWNPLQGLIGRNARDILAISIVTIALLTMFLGIRMKLHRAKQLGAKTPTPDTPPIAKGET